MIDSKSCWYSESCYSMIQNYLRSWIKMRTTQNSRMMPMSCCWTSCLRGKKKTKTPNSMRSWKMKN